MQRSSSRSKSQSGSRAAPSPSGVSRGSRGATRGSSGSRSPVSGSPRSGSPMSGSPRSGSPRPGSPRSVSPIILGSKDTCLPSADSTAVILKYQATIRNPKTSALQRQKLQDRISVIQRSEQAKIAACQKRKSMSNVRTQQKFQQNIARRTARHQQQQVESAAKARRRAQEEETKRKIAKREAEISKLERQGKKVEVAKAKAELAAFRKEAGIKGPVEQGLIATGIIGAMGVAAYMFFG